MTYRTFYRLAQATFVTALSFCVVPLLAAAEDSAPAKSRSAVAPLLETVVITAQRREHSLRELAGNSASVAAADLALVRHTHIEESLRRVAGVNFARGSGQEYLPALRSPVLTGAGACGSVLSMMDGIALRAAGFCNVNELFDAHTEAAGRIEVVRGPAQAAYGSNAVHGMINVVSPEVGDQALAVARFEAGPEDFMRASASAANPLAAHRLRADLTVAQDRGFRASSGYDQQKMSLRLDHSSGAKSRSSIFNLTHLDQQTASYLVGTNAYRDEDLRKTNADPDAYRNNLAARLLHRVRYQLDERRSVTVSPYLRYTDMDFLMHFLPGRPVESNGQQSIGLQALFQVVPVEIREEKQASINVGIDLEYTDAYLRQTQALPTSGSAFLVATIPPGKQYDYEVAATQAAVFVDAHWPLAARWRLAAGLRLEHMAYDYDNRMLSGRTDQNGTPCAFGGCRYSRPADRSDRFTNVSPNLGLLYSWSDDHQFFMTVSHGFRAPQASELYRLQREQSVANLDSEEIVGIEFGSRGQAAALAYEINLFAYSKDHVIFRDSGFFNVSGGQTIHRGIEASVDYAFKRNYSAGLRGSYAIHQYDNDRLSGGVNINGNDVDGAPRYFGSLFLRKDFSHGGQLELEWQHQGSYYTDPENMHQYAGHRLVNARAQWPFNERWRAGLRLVNITDVKYADRADYTSFSGDRYFPAARRSAFAEIQYRLF